MEVLWIIHVFDGGAKTVITWGNRMVGTLKNVPVGLINNTGCTWYTVCCMSNKLRLFPKTSLKFLPYDATAAGISQSLDGHELEDK
jgi:hypothetical protein